MKLTQDQCTGAYIEHRYIERLTERVARLLGIENVEKLRNYNDLTNYEYHPYTSDTLLLANNNIYKYMMPIGCVIWSVNLGRYDVMYTVVDISRYNMSPCVGHCKASLRIVRYLHYYKKSRVVFITMK